MINNPKLIKGIIEQIENVPKSILDEVILEILEENNYSKMFNELPETNYIQEMNFDNDFKDLYMYNLPSTRTSQYQLEQEREVAA